MMEVNNQIGAASGVLPIPVKGGAAAEWFDPSVPVEKLVESAWNPRKSFNEPKLQELAGSFRQVGVTTPLLARPIDGTDSYEIAAGHRRRRAALIAELKTLPVLIRRMTDEQFRDVLSIENLQREDIHPMEEAEACYQWLKGPGHTVQMLAAKLSKSDSYISQRLRLLELITPLREDFRTDRLTIGHAIALARLGAAQQKELREQYLYDHTGGAVSLRALQVAIETKVYLDLGRAVFSISDEKLTKAGSCDRCQKRTGASPALFPEVKEKDNCLDRACFTAKAAAHASQKLKVLEKKSASEGTPAGVKISAHWATEKEGVLANDRYKIVRKGGECEYTVTGVCVEEQRHGQGEIRLGEAVKICTNRKCRPHWGGLYSGPTSRADRTPDELRSELRVREKEEKARAVETALITAAVEAAPYPFTAELWRELARVMWGRLWPDHRVRVFARRGMKQQTSRDGGRVDVMDNAIREMDESELAGLVAEIAIMESNAVRGSDDGLTMQEMLLAPKGEEFLRALEEEAVAPIKAAYAEKKARIDRAEQKKAADAKAAKAAAKNEPAAKNPAAAKKGKK